MPLSAAAGLSWRAFRKMLGSSYADLTVLSIAANGKDMSFSADTGMAECLVIARKLKTGEPPGTRLLFSSLTHRPQGLPLQALWRANSSMALTSGKLRTGRMAVRS